MVLAGALGIAHTAMAQVELIPQPVVNLAGWASQFELSWAGSYSALENNVWVHKGSFIRLGINPTEAIFAPLNSNIEGLPTVPEEVVTSWGPTILYGDPPSTTPQPGATHLQFDPPSTPGGPAQAPKRLGYFLRIPFSPGLVPDAPSTSYTVSIDVHGDYTWSDAPLSGITPPPNSGPRDKVRCTTRLVFAISKSPARAGSVDTRLAYGNPDAEGKLIPDPNASLGHLAFRPYSFKGGMFVGTMPVGSKDKSGTAWMHIASPGLPAPPTNAWLMGRCVQLYCSETPPGITHDFSINPVLTTSIFAQAFYDQPAKTWTQRANIEPPTEDTYSVSLQGVRRNFLFRSTGPKTNSAVGYTGVAILPPTSLSNVVPPGGSSQSQTGVWKYFVQDGATPKTAPPEGMETQPVTYNVYLLSGQVIYYNGTDAETGKVYYYP